MRRILRQQRRRRRGAAGQRFVMKSLPLLVEPEIAGHHAKNQAASLPRVAIIGRGVNVEPDMLHMGEVAAQLLDHLVAFTLGAETRALHDFEFLELGPVLQNHVEIGVESAGGDDDGFAADLQKSRRCGCG